MKEEIIKHTNRKAQDKKSLINHMNKIIGQMNGIKKMIEEDRYCNDILIQLSAVDHSIKSISDKMIKNHLETCVIEEIKKGNTNVMEEVTALLKRFHS